MGEDGNVYEGRTWGVEGAHTRGYNTAAHGYCVIGNFMTRLPNQLALNALQNIIECGVERVSRGYKCINTTVNTFY